MLHELKEAFQKKRQEAQGSHERMKSLADKCVLAYNEAEKRKSLGRPGIDPGWQQRKRRSFLLTSLHLQAKKPLALSSQAA